MSRDYENQTQEQLVERAINADYVIRRALSAQLNRYLSLRSKANYDIIIANEQIALFEKAIKEFDETGNLIVDLGP